MEQDKPKVILILEDSERTGWGVVKDCHGSMPINMSDCEVVGTWGLVDDGTFYVELTTTVEAQQDVLIQLIKERIEARRLEWGDNPPAPGRQPVRAKWDPTMSYLPTAEELAASAGTERRTTSRAVTKVTVDREITKEFGSLRDRLKRR